MAKAKKIPKAPKKQTAKKPATHVKKEADQNTRPFWRGYITFGLVNIPVTLHSAEKGEQEVHFKLLDKNDLAGIKYVKVNAKTGKEVAWTDIVKGYEYERDNYAILTDEDFAAIAREKLKTIEIEDFIDLDELPFMCFEHPYYLVPDKHGEKGYVLLREVLKETRKVGIAKIVIRTHQYLVAVIPYESAIIVNTLRYPAEIKKPDEMILPDEAISKYKITKKEIDIAEQLVSAMTTKWDPDHYHNEYREDLLKRIKAKIASGGKKSIAHLEEPKIKQSNVVDFMTLLKKSIKENQAKKQGKK